MEPFTIATDDLLQRPTNDGVFFVVYLTHPAVPKKSLTTSVSLRTGETAEDGWQDMLLSRMKKKLTRTLERYPELPRHGWKSYKETGKGR